MEMISKETKANGDKLLLVSVPAALLATSYIEVTDIKDIGLGINIAPELLIKLLPLLCIYFFTLTVLGFLSDVIQVDSHSSLFPSDEDYKRRAFDLIIALERAKYDVRKCKQSERVVFENIQRYLEAEIQRNFVSLERIEFVETSDRRMLLLFPYSLVRLLFPLIFGGYTIGMYGWSDSLTTFFDFAAHLK